MRGDEGDLAKALELGDHALEIWPPGEQPIELAEHYHLQADVHYWTWVVRTRVGVHRPVGRDRRPRSRGRRVPRAGSGMRALILAGMGRYEESIEAGTTAIETARKLDRRDSVMLNYSTLPPGRPSRWMRLESGARR